MFKKDEEIKKNFKEKYIKQIFLINTNLLHKHILSAFYMPS